MLAITGPLFALGIAINVFVQPPEKMLSEAALHMETKLAEEKPDVILLGNSMARLGVNEKQLSKILNAKVMNLSVDGSSASLWYLVLKNRVFANGHRPHAVIILGAARTHLAPFPLSSLETVNVGDHREPIEPVFDGKAQGDGSRPSQWLWATWRRDRLRQQLLDGLRNWTVGTFFAQDIVSENAEAEAWAQAQLELVFGGEQNLTGTTSSRVIPVVEIAKDEQVEQNHDATESYLPDLVALAEKHNTRLVFSRMPTAPIGPGNHQLLDLSDAPFEAEWNRALEWMQTTAATYIDLRSIPMIDSDFMDFLHANRNGQKKITQQLGERLKQMDIMGNAPLPRVVTLSPSEPVRSGPLPTIPALALENASLKDGECRWEIPWVADQSLATGPMNKLGLANASPIALRTHKGTLSLKTKLNELKEGCTGTAFLGKKTVILNGTKAGELPSNLRSGIAEQFPSQATDGSPLYWVFPGQKVTTTFPTAWPEAAGEFQVSLSAIQLGDAPSLGLSVNGQAIQTTAARGGIVEAVVNQDAPTDAWTLALSVPENGVPTLVQSLGIGEGFHAHWLIGTPNTVATHRAVGSKRSTTRYGNAPPSISFGVPTEIAPGVMEFNNQKLAFLGDDHTYGMTGRWGCSPVQVTVDGQRIGKGHRRCRDVPTLSEGAYCHTKQSIRIRAVTEGAQAIAPDRWGTQLDPDRKCGNRRWLFPGDSLTANPWRQDTQSMLRGIRSVVIAGNIMDPIGVKRKGTDDPEQPVIHVHVHHGEQSLLKYTLTRADLNGEALQFAIDPPVYASTEPVYFVFESDPSAPYAIISSAAVSEQRIASPVQAVTP